MRGQDLVHWVQQAAARTSQTSVIIRAWALDGRGPMRRWANARAHRRAPGLIAVAVAANAPSQVAVIATRGAPQAKLGSGGSRSIPGMAEVGGRSGNPQ